jgi:hypothetical protein
LRAIQTCHCSSRRNEAQKSEHRSNVYRETFEASTDSQLIRAS